MKTLILILLAAIPLMAQQNVNYVASTGNVSLISTATAATLQQPTTNSKPVSFPSSTDGGAPPVGASVYCSVACVATVSRNGTAASATAGTVVNVNPTEPPALITFYTASNTTPGTTLAVFNVGAGATQGIDLSALKLGAGGNLINLTISIASVTGTVNITFYPVEQH